jgi:hypothetical protein
MPELDLTNALALRVGNRNALALRIADQTIWEATEQYLEHTVFGQSTLADYGVYSDLEPGCWLGANFYTAGAPYHSNWSIVGVRIWVPLEGSEEIVGQSGYVALRKVEDTYNDIIVGMPEYRNGQAIIDSFENDGSKTSFANLQPGWNDIYLNQAYPMKHGNGFSVGYQIGDGSYYIAYDYPNAVSIQASDGTNLYLSEHGSVDGEPKRAEFGKPNVGAAWSPFHYGLDVIVREPAGLPTSEHSIWGKEEWPETGNYTIGNDLIADSWTASNFYSYSGTGTPESGWTLIGARLWIPPAEDDPYDVVGMSAECGYFIKASGAIGETDSPGDIINEIITSPTVTTTLVRGWNEVYFDTPITLPWASGIAIGWKIGSGAYYSAAQLSPPPIRAKDYAPFYLASSAVGSERRGEYTIEGASATWSFQDAHYGSDIIVKEPPVYK